MTREATFDGLPCELCGKDSGCACPPCDCVTCRQRRGEDLTQDERRQINGFTAAIENQQRRSALAEMTSAIGDALRRHREGESSAID